MNKIILLCFFCQALISRTHYFSQASIFKRHFIQKPKKNRIRKEPLERPTEIETETTKLLGSGTLYRIRIRRSRQPGSESDRSKCFPVFKLNQDSNFKQK